MICPKCGNECDNSLVFCNICGSKLHETLNDYEKDNNINENKPFDNIIGGISNDNKEKDISANNARQNSNKGTEKIIVDKTELDSGLYEKQLKPTNKKGSNNSDQKKRNSTKSDKNKTNSSYVSTGLDVKSPKEKASKKNKILVVIIAIFAVAIAVVATYQIKKATMTKSFNQYFNQGQSYFKAENYKFAKTQFITAANNAFTNSQKIKVYEMIYKVDELIGGYDEEEIKYMELLVDLDDENITFYQNLIILYQNNDLDNKIEPLIQAAPESIRSKLESFDGTIPVASEKSGTYNKPIEIELRATKNVKIYYTLDGSSATNSSTKKVYKTPIKLENEGKYKLRAMSVDSNGKKSKEMSNDYTLDFGKVSEPVVDLDSGKYTEQKEITVTCDEGCTIYYTKDSSVPTKKDKEYKKPIKLPRGNSIYYFIAIDSDGVYSSVVTRAYDYSPEYSVSYNSALETLTNKLISDGTLENQYGEFKNGSRAYFNYGNTVEIDDEFYYIITCNIESKKGSIKSSKTYAISCDNGSISEATGSGNDYTLQSSNSNSNENDTKASD